MKPKSKKPRRARTVTKQNASKQTFEPDDDKWRESDYPPRSAKDAGRFFAIERVLEAIEAQGVWRKTTDDCERDELDSARKGVEIEIERLGRAFKGIPDDFAQEKIKLASVIDELLFAFIGLSNCLLPNSIAYRNELSWRAWQMRNARTAKHRPAIEKRREAIKAKFGTQMFVDSEKFAESIKAEVNAALDHEQLQPVSARTIRRDIRAILEECEKNKGLSSRARRRRETKE